MSSYFIFALVLTVLYIVYYAVNITRDLYGKKGTEKTDEEVFDLGPMDATEESVEVSENETGFKIGNETYGTETVPAASPAAQNGDTGKKDGTAKDRLERLKAKAEAQMEKVPYLLVLGKNEVADRTVSYRLHGEQQSTTVSMEDFLAMLQEDIRTKKLNPAAAK